MMCDLPANLVVSLEGKKQALQSMHASRRGMNSMDNLNHLWIAANPVASCGSCCHKWGRFFSRNLGTTSEPKD